MEVLKTKREPVIKWAATQGNVKSAGHEGQGAKDTPVYVRTADTLFSPKELTMSEQTKLFIFSELKTPLERLVLFGRTAALRHQAYPEENSPAWEKDLVEALRDSGFIRRDLFPNTFRIWRLYADLFEETKHLCVSNEFYENLVPVTDAQLGQIVYVVGTLPANECTTIMMRYGLTGGDPVEYWTISDMLHCPVTEVKELEQEAIKQLRSDSWSDGLPSLFGWENTSIYARRPSAEKVVARAQA